MRTRTKIWLMTAASLVLIGCILFAGVMAALKWDFMDLATVNYETNTYEISESFDGISMNTDTEDIVFMLSDDGNCTVECHEEANAKHSVAVEDGILTVKRIDERTVYDFRGFIGLNFDSPRITVYLPETEYKTLLISGDTSDVEISNDFMFEDMDISLGTGDVCIENISAESLDLTVSTGKVTVLDVTCEGEIVVGVSTGDAYLTDIACKSMRSSGDTGDIFLDNVIAAEKLLVERSTGDVTFSGCDAAEIYVNTDTGDVGGSLLSGKAFIANTDTGTVDVPKTADGGKCEIITNTGDIKLNIQ